MLRLIASVSILLLVSTACVSTNLQLSPPQLITPAEGETIAARPYDFTWTYAAQASDTVQLVFDPEQALDPVDLTGLDGTWTLDETTDPGLSCYGCSWWISVTGSGANLISPRRTLTADFVPPTLSSSVPAANATEVDPSLPLDLTFSEPVLFPDDLPTAVSLECGGIISNLALESTAPCTTCRFAPDNDLPSSASCILTLTGAVQDRSQLPLAGDAMSMQTINFETGFSGATPSTLYVDAAGGSDSNAGTSPDLPLQTLSAALDQVNALAGAISDVRLCTGRYEVVDTQYIDQTLTISGGYDCANFVDVVAGSGFPTFAPDFTEVAYAAGTEQVHIPTLEIQGGTVILRRLRIVGGEGVAVGGGNIPSAAVWVTQSANVLVDNAWLSGGDGRTADADQVFGSAGLYVDDGSTVNVTASLLDGGLGEHGLSHQGYGSAALVFSPTAALSSSVTESSIDGGMGTETAADPGGVAAGGIVVYTPSFAGEIRGNDIQTFGSACAGTGCFSAEGIGIRSNVSGMEISENAIAGCVDQSAPAFCAAINIEAAGTLTINANRIDGGFGAGSFGVRLELIDDAAANQAELTLDSNLIHSGIGSALATAVSLSTFDLLDTIVATILGNTIINGSAGSNVTNGMFLLIPGAADLVMRDNLISTTFQDNVDPRGISINRECADLDGLFREFAHNVLVYPTLTEGSPFFCNVNISGMGAWATAVDPNGASQQNYLLTQEASCGPARIPGENTVRMTGCSDEMTCAAMIFDATEVTQNDVLLGNLRLLGDGTLPCVIAEGGSGSSMSIKDAYGDDRAGSVAVGAQSFPTGCVPFSGEPVRQFGANGAIIEDLTNTGDSSEANAAIAAANGDMIVVGSFTSGSTESALAIRVQEDSALNTAWNGNGTLQQVVPSASGQARFNEITETNGFFYAGGAWEDPLATEFEKQFLVRSFDDTGGANPAYGANSRSIRLLGTNRDAEVLDLAPWRNSGELMLAGNVINANNSSSSVAMALDASGAMSTNWNGGSTEETLSAPAERNRTVAVETLTNPASHMFLEDVEAGAPRLSRRQATGTGAALGQLIANHSENTVTAGVVETIEIAVVNGWTVEDMAVDEIGRAVYVVGTHVNDLIVARVGIDGATVPFAANLGTDPMWMNGHLRFQTSALSSSATGQIEVTSITGDWNLGRLYITGSLPNLGGYVLAIDLFRGCPALEFGNQGIVLLRDAIRQGVRFTGDVANDVVISSSLDRIYVIGTSQVGAAETRMAVWALHN